MPGKQGKEYEYDDTERRAMQSAAGASPHARLSLEDEEQLSAYLDNALGAKERARFEGRLRTEANLAQALSELRAMRGLLRALPQPRLPRSFLLPESDDDEVAAAPPARKARTTPPRVAHRGAPLWSRAVTWSGGLAAILGIALFIGLMMTSGGATFSVMNVPGPHTSSSGTTAGSSTNATQARPVDTPQFGRTTPVITSQTPTIPDANVSTPTASAVGVSTHTANGSSGSNGASSSPPLSLPTLAILLVIAGILLVVIGRLGARMRG